MTSWLPQINLAQCTKCGNCIMACPTHALASIDQHPVLINPAACTYCAVCETICPTSAIALPYLICINPSNPSHKE